MQHRHPNIFLFGEAGAGKDTVAALLGEVAQYHQVALAEPIKMEYVRWFSCSATKADRAKVIEIGETYKKLYGADIWCKRAQTHIEAWQGLTKGPVLISDGRHWCEFDHFVTDRGYVPVYLFADVEVRMKRLLERDGVDQREVLRGKELEVREMRCRAKYVLVNNGFTTDNLRVQVQTMLDSMRGWCGSLAE